MYAQQLSGKIMTFSGKAQFTSNIPATKQRSSDEQHTAQAAALAQHFPAHARGASSLDSS